MKTDFSKRLKLIRGSLTQAQFAEKTGISQAAIVKYEKGRYPQGEELLKIIRATGVSADWLLTGEGEMHSKKSSYLVAAEGERVYYQRDQVGGLSEDEERLLKGYRSLSDEAKKNILETLNLLKK